jgi:preprotein translocase subunit YajC
MNQTVFFILYIAFFIGIMYLLIFLPQKRRDKKAKEMLNALTVGSNITTIGGITGKIINIKEDEITIESGIENTKILVKRWAIKDVEKPIEA